MNGRDLLLILTHLFRKKGNPVLVEDAVDFISFRCRYGAPNQIRRMIKMAIDNEMVSLSHDVIKAEFLFDKQNLSPNLASRLSDKIRFGSGIEQIA